MQLTHAFISVVDTRGIDELARFLVEQVKVEILAPSHTAAFLRARNVPVTETATLFAHHDRTDPALRTIAGQAVQIVVVNLPPPFRRAPADLGFDLILDGIDRVGPTVAMAAILRYRDTCVIMDPADYPTVVSEYQYKGDFDEPFCRKQARHALSTLALYEGPLMRELSMYDDEGIRQDLPEIVLGDYHRLSKLRSGSNKQQEAWLFRSAHPVDGTLPTTMNFSPSGKVTASRARDVCLATELLAEMPHPTAVVIARQRPVAVASAQDIELALATVLRQLAPGLSEPVVAINVPASAQLLARLENVPMQVFVAPSFDPDAIDRLAEREGIALLATGGTLASDLADLSITIVPGAAILEQRDARSKDEVAAGDAGGHVPTHEQKRLLAFAWTIAKFTRSDAVVLAREERGVTFTVGVGDAAVSRRHAIEKAIWEAGEASAAAVLASDGPIVLADDFQRIAQAGIAAVAHPGGPEDGRTFQVGGQPPVAILATNLSHIRY